MPMYSPDLKRDELSAMGIELAISEDDYDEKLASAAKNLSLLNRKPLSERLPKHVFERIHRDIGQASMCWENIDKAGVFEAKKAADIAFELCHFIANAIDSKQEVKR